MTIEEFEEKCMDVIEQIVAIDINKIVKEQLKFLKRCLKRQNWKETKKLLKSMSAFCKNLNLQVTKNMNFWENKSFHKRK